MIGTVLRDGSEWLLNAPRSVVQTPPTPFFFLKLHMTLGLNDVFFLCNTFSERC
jgi:hypothetical protein